MIRQFNKWIGQSSIWWLFFCSCSDWQSCTFRRRSFFHRTPYHSKRENQDGVNAPQINAPRLPCRSDVTNYSFEDPPIYFHASFYICVLMHMPTGALLHERRALHKQYQQQQQHPPDDKLECPTTKNIRSMFSKNTAHVLHFGENLKRFPFFCADRLGSPIF